MSNQSPHRATPEQWQRVEVCAGRDYQIPWSTAPCLLDLRARVEALEAGDREDADAWTGVRRTMYELRARVEALEAAQQPDAEAAQSADPQMLHTVALQMVDNLGRSFGILPEILDTLRRAIREPIGAESLTDGADAPAPASSLVDAVASALAVANWDPPELWSSDAATAALTVADWLEKQKPGVVSTGWGWADLIRREVQQ